jgi:hypothetical protein
MSLQCYIAFALLTSLALVPLTGATRTNAAVPQTDFRLTTDGSPQTLSPSVSTDWWTGVQENIRQSEYHVTWQDHTYLPGVPAAYQAPNRAHDLRTYFASDGLTIIPRILSSEESATPSWHWGLCLVAWGGAESLQPVDAAILYADANRIEYRRGELTEWYVNDERGLEQGFTITRPPQQVSLAQRTVDGENLVMELALTGDLTPNLTGDGTAIEFATPDGSRTLRYSGLRASDATGRRLPVRLEFLPSSPGNRRGARVVVEDTAAVYPITLISRLTSAAIASMGLSTNPDWTADGGQFGAYFGYSAGTAGDVNGDGYSDIIVGALGYDNGQADEGRAFVYYGSAVGLSTTANWTAESDQTNAQFGGSVGTAGDVNGDGYADVIVGTPNYDNGQEDEGAVFVYYGSAAGLSVTANWMAEGGQANPQFGRSVSTAGDVNSDGYSDIIIGDPAYNNGEISQGRALVYYGSAAGLSATPGWTIVGDQEGTTVGYSVSTAGDVNGDGYADVIIGAAFYNTTEENAGRVYVYHGSATGLTPGPANWTVDGPQVDGSLGWSVGTAGDVNSDGYADVIVAEAYGGEWYEGRVYVYHGSAAGLTTTADWEAEGNQDFAHFGEAAGTAGDVNGDGYSDIIVGASTIYVNGQASVGRAFVYHGGPDGLATDEADWTVEGDYAEARLGNPVATAGDVNGDGYADVIVGAPYYDSGETAEGRVFVYHGSAAGLSTTADWTAESNQAEASFGVSAGTAGDVNGDGYADVIVGAYHYDNGQENEGRAFVYYGSAVGLSTTADWTAESNQAEASFGVSVGTAGDVNGDGYADVIVSAYHYDNGYENEGAVFVYHGSGVGLSATADWTAESDQVGACLGWSVGTAGDVNGDGYADVIVGAPYYGSGETDEGRAYVYYGSAAGLSAAADWTAESNQAEASLGNSVGTAGDVNGDGYSDIIIGAAFYHTTQERAGRVYVYHGSATGLTPGPANWTVEGTQVNGTLGWSVSTAGDVNGDGYADVIVAEAYGGEEYEGRVYVYHGSATGLTTTADWTAEGDQEGAGFGESVSTAGDVNGDGCADVIVGAEFYDNGQTDEGRAYVYYGNGGNGLALRPRQMRSDGSVHVSPLGISDSPTAVQLRLNGRMPLGREKVKLQWQVAPLGTPFTATTVISGTSATWTDALPTGTVLIQNVTGLTPLTPYHWRVRLLYHPGNRLGQPASRWIHIPWNGWMEQDFRTPEQAIAGLVATNDGPTLLGDLTALTATITAGSNVSYTWTFGDDTAGSGAVVTHTYPAAGVYMAVVTASNSVSVLTATTTVTVSPLSPVERYVYLPLILHNYAPPVTFPLHIGDPIPARAVAYQGEVFYRKTVQMPAELPSGGKFYFSSRRDVVAEVLVDDELAVLSDGADVFTYLVSGSGHPVPAFVEVPRATMEQLAGLTAVIEYRDVYSVLVEASEMWLIWIP